VDFLLYKLSEYSCVFFFDIYICIYTLGQHPYSEWSNSNQLMLSNTGHTIQEYNKILYLIEEQLLSIRQKHTISNHNIHLPTTQNMLCITLYYLKHYHTIRYISIQFGWSRMTIQRSIEYTIESLFLYVVPVYIVFDPSTFPSPSDSSALSPSTKLIIDASVIAIHQPELSQDRKTYYYYKSGTKYGLKFQLTTTLNGHIVHVSDVVQSSIHDITLFRSSTLPSLLSDDLEILGDKGYLGGNHIITPKKKEKNKKMTRNQISDNRMISSERVVVENVFHRIKQYHLVGTIYRGNRNDLAKITHFVHVICALTNLNMQSHPVRA
jgi:hypothetical protein